MQQDSSTPFPSKSWETCLMQVLLSEERKSLKNIPDRFAFSKHDAENTIPFLCQN